MALATDFGYLLTALWDSFPLRGVVGQWARHRYRALAPHYDRYIEHADEYGAPLLAALELLPGIPHRVLDVSTGTGFAAELTAQRCPQAVTMACDVSLAMLSQARERLPGTPVVCCDSSHLPFGDSAFDLVLLTNAPPALRELVRIVSPEGWLILAFSAAGKVPAWMPSTIQQRLGQLGLTEIHWNRTGRGLYIMAQRRAREDAA